MEMEDRESAGTDCHVLAVLGALLLAAWFLPLNDSDHLGQVLKYTTGMSGAPVQHAILCRILLTNAAKPRQTEGAELA